MHGMAQVHIPYHGNSIAYSTHGYSIPYSMDIEFNIPTMDMSPSSISLVLLLDQLYMNNCACSLRCSSSHCQAIFLNSLPNEYFLLLLLYYIILYYYH